MSLREQLISELRILCESLQLQEVGSAVAAHVSDVQLILVEVECENRRRRRYW